MFISDSIKEQLHNPKIHEFFTEIEKLPSALKRNIGGLHEIQGLSSLAHTIEMEKALAVADASIGTRHRASHAYIVESRCERFRIVGIAPVDGDEDDLESMRAELWRQIAIQTIFNTICEQLYINSGSVDTYNDNMDSHHHVNLHYFGPKLDLRFRGESKIPPKFHTLFHWKAKLI